MRIHTKITLCLFTLLAITPASAQTVEELKQQLEAQKQQLEAQKQINELQKQRIRKLEEQLAGERGEVVAQPSPQPTPKQAADDPEAERALERALVRQGLSVLPPGRWELTPGLEWAHSGASALRSKADDYAATLDARVGLPGGTMFGIGVPYFIKSERDSADNSGFGDLAVRAWKQILSQTDTRPSLIGSLSYRAPTGEDTGPVPLGSEFHRLTAGISTSKSINPVVLFGGAFYSHAFSEDINGVKVQPGDGIGFRAGSSLAVTPEITGSFGVSISFIDDVERDGAKINGSDQTVGFLELSTGFLLNRRTFLSLFASVGITDDAPDVILGVSLPIRY